MKTDKTETLDKYYARRGILPTHAGFSGSKELDAYEMMRRKFFTSKLYLPPAMFYDTHVLEFGPDTGENALVFARWGATMTLVEPNAVAKPHILEYFERFGLSERLYALHETDIQGFKSERTFPLIIAEGFIYTIRPKKVWIRALKRLIDTDGFFVISYYEKYGALLELLLKVIYTRMSAITGQNGSNIAWQLFQGKWKSVSHTRAFNSWVMDVLENPFVRLSYFFEAADLCTELYKEGFDLHASWPRYSDELAIYWHKKEINAQHLLKANAVHIARSRLSFAFGRKLFLCVMGEDELRKVNELLDELLNAVDKLIDEFDISLIEFCSNILEHICGVIASQNVLADSEAHRQKTIDLIDSLRKLIVLLIQGNAGKIVTFCNSDEPFIQSWGVPGHFAVFKRTISR